MSKLKILSAAFIAVGLAACSRPASIPQEPSAQYKMGYLQHWQFLARRTADALVEDMAHHPELGAGFMLSSTPAGGEAAASPRPWYIHQNGSAFGQEFAKLLEQELLVRGHQVSTVPQEATVVNLDASTFLYPDEDASPLKIGPGILAGTLAAVGIVNHDANWSRGDWAAVALGVGALHDIVSALTDSARGEVLFTTTVMHRDRIIQRYVETFYAEPSRLSLYWSDSFSGPLQMDGAQAADQPLTHIRIQ